MRDLIATCSVPAAGNLAKTLSVDSTTVNGNGANRHVIEQPAELTAAMMN